MCRALKVLCAAPSPERLAELKGGSVSVHWELAGGAISVAELADQVTGYGPDIVVLDASLGPAAVAAARSGAKTVQVISVGVEVIPGADGHAATPDEIRDAILGAPRPGGPVRG
jgi:hypothetical protein